MDIVLEVFDTFLFDRVYASLLPLKGSPSPHTWSPLDLLAQAVRNVSAVSSSNSNSNSNSNSSSAASSWTALEESHIQNWHYQPASKYFHVEPTPYAYMSRWPRDAFWRQALSLYAITWLFGMVMYFGIASASYYLVFDKETMKHPKFLKNQIRREITQTVRSIPTIALLTIPFFLLEIRGYSRIYDALPVDSPWYLGGWYSVLQFPFFFLFTDCGIYWIHRWLHIPAVYKRLHKPHHKWVLPSPFASHAFHPVDGWSQSLPYHIFPLLFPLNKLAYMALFTFIQFWTVMIHDGEFYADNAIINGAACHAVHHMEFLGNYGQFTTLFDRLGGTYRPPGSETFQQNRGKKEQ